MTAETTNRMGLGPVTVAGAAVIVLFFGGFGGWAALAPLESAAIGSGEVSVESYRKTVQHLEGGIVREIKVRDGEAVAVGQPLFILDQTQASAGLDVLMSRRRVAAARAARLEAQRDGAETIAFPDWLSADIGAGRADRSIIESQKDIFAARQKTIDGQTAILTRRIAQVNEEVSGLQRLIASEKRQLALIGQETRDVQKLFDKKLTPKSRLLALQRRAAEIEGSRARNQAAVAKARQTVGETMLQISELQTRQVDEAVRELNEVQAELLDINERIRAAQDVMARTVVTAPSEGVVMGLKVHTVGAVVSPGQELLDIVPSKATRIVEARVRPEDIDEIHPGQDARVHFTGLSGNSHRPVTGRLTSVSADRLTDERTGRPYYLVRVAVDEDELVSKLENVKLYPGMPAEVMVITGARTPLDYLLEPVRTSLRRAMKET